MLLHYTYHLRLYDTSIEYIGDKMPTLSKELQEKLLKEKNVDLSNRQLTTEHLHDIVLCMQKNPDLEEINLSRNNLEALSDEFLQAIKNHPALTRVNIDNNVYSTTEKRTHITYKSEFIPNKRTPSGLEELTIAVEHRSNAEVRKYLDKKYSENLISIFTGKEKNLFSANEALSDLRLIESNVGINVFVRKINKIFDNMVEQLAKIEKNGYDLSNVKLKYDSLNNLIQNIDTGLKEGTLKQFEMNSFQRISLHYLAEKLSDNEVNIKHSLKKLVLSDLSNDTNNDFQAPLKTLFEEIESIELKNCKVTDKLVKSIFGAIKEINSLDDQLKSITLNECEIDQDILCNLLKNIALLTDKKIDLNLKNPPLTITADKLIIGKSESSYDEPALKELIKIIQSRHSIREISIEDKNISSTIVNELLTALKNTTEPAISITSAPPSPIAIRLKNIKDFSKIQILGKLDHSIHTFEISNTNLKESALTHLVEIANSQNKIESLSLKQCNLLQAKETTAITLAGAISNMANLKSLDISDIQADKEFMPELIRKIGSSVKTFNLSGVELGAFSIQELEEKFNNENTTIEEINLARCKIGNSDKAALITALGENKTLKSINLSGVPLYSDDVNALVTLIKNNKTIKSLTIKDCNITKEQLNEIEEAIADYNTSLTTLEIEENNKTECLNKIIQRNCAIGSVDQIDVIKENIVSCHNEYRLKLKTMTHVSENTYLQYLNEMTNLYDSINENMLTLKNEYHCNYFHTEYQGLMKDAFVFYCNSLPEILKKYKGSNEALYGLINQGIFLMNAVSKAINQEEKDKLDAARKSYMDIILNEETFDLNQALTIADGNKILEHEAYELEIQIYMKSIERDTVVNLGFVEGLAKLLKNYVIHAITNKITLSADEKWAKMISEFCTNSLPRLIQQCNDIDIKDLIQNCGMLIRNSHTGENLINTYQRCLKSLSERTTTKNLKESLKLAHESLYVLSAGCQEPSLKEYINDLYFNKYNSFLSEDSLAKIINLNNNNGQQDENIALSLKMFEDIFECISENKLKIDEDNLGLLIKKYIRYFNCFNQMEKSKSQLLEKENELGPLINQLNKTSQLDKNNLLRIAYKFKESFNHLDKTDLLEKTNELNKLFNQLVENDKADLLGIANKLQELHTWVQDKLPSDKFTKIGEDRIEQYNAYGFQKLADQLFSELSGEPKKGQNKLRAILDEIHCHQIKHLVLLDNMNARTEAKKLAESRSNLKLERDVEMMNLIYRAYVTDHLKLSQDTDNPDQKSKYIFIALGMANLAKNIDTDNSSSLFLDCYKEINLFIEHNINNPKYLKECSELGEMIDLNTISVDENSSKTEISIFYECMKSKLLCTKKCIMNIVMKNKLEETLFKNVISLQEIEKIHDYKNLISITEKIIKAHKTFIGAEKKHIKDLMLIKNSMEDIHTKEERIAKFSPKEFDYEKIFSLVHQRTKGNDESVIGKEGLNYIGESVEKNNTLDTSVAITIEKTISLAHEQSDDAANQKTKKNHETINNNSLDTTSLASLVIQNSSVLNQPTSNKPNSPVVTKMEETKETENLNTSKAALNEKNSNEIIQPSSGLSQEESDFPSVPTDDLPLEDEQQLEKETSVPTDELPLKDERQLENETRVALCN